MKRRVPLREPVGVALETLRAHKMRSFLMLLGIILSVATLIHRQQGCQSGLECVHGDALSDHHGDGRTGQSPAPEQTGHLGRL
jgi:hypothetical protein